MLDGWEVCSYAIIPSRLIVGTSNSTNFLDRWTGFEIVSSITNHEYFHFSHNQIWDVQLIRSQSEDYPSL